jgi:hypothetical protein
MSEIPETPTNAARALIGWFAGALAFEAVHAYAEGGSTLAALGYGIGAIVVVIGDYKLKALLAGSPRLTKSLNDIAADARWWVAVGLVSLLIIAVSPYIEQRVAPWLLAALGALGIGIALFSGLKRHATPVASVLGASVSSGNDTQTGLDIIHLLNFAVSEAAFWNLDRLLEMSESPEVTDGFEDGPNTEKAHKSREFYIGYVRQELGQGTHRFSSYLTVMHTAQWEAEQELEQTPQDQRPTDLDPLMLRKYRISERQFGRAIRFLQSERRQLKEKLAQSRSSLSERINTREAIGRG